MKGVIEVRNKKYKVIIITLLIFLIIANIYILKENRNLKQNRGDEIGDLSDIVLRMYPEDILERIIQVENISNDNFEFISGEFKTGIVFYALSNGIPEIESYFRYMEAQFLEFKKTYQESQGEDIENIAKIRQELADTCERGLKLYNELEKYRDKDNESAESRMWYKAYKNKNHKVRELITEILGEERTTYP